MTYIRWYIHSLDSTDIKDLLAPSHCSTLEHNNLQVIPDELGQLTSLTFLNLGANKLRKLPPVQKLTALQQLHLHHNQLADVPQGMLDDLQQLQALSLASNRLAGNVAEVLGGVWGSSSLRWLNVSHNKQLTLDGEWARGWAEQQLLEVVDISGSDITLTPQMCTSGVSLFASAAAAPQGGYQQVVESCAETGRANLLDISPDNAAQMQLSLSASYELLLAFEDIDKMTFRLQTSKSPVQCNLHQGFRALYDSTGQLVTFPVLEYQCRCSQGYIQGGDGVCYTFWSAGRIAGLALGCTTLAILSTLVATMICLSYSRRRRRLALDLDLHKGLLEESSSDVLALKRAWEIEWRDVDLTARIDQGAEGAFGEVCFCFPC